MTRKHKKRAEISIKTSKFMTSHVEPPALAGNRIFSGTVLNAKVSWAKSSISNSSQEYGEVITHGN